MTEDHNRRDILKTVGLGASVGPATLLAGCSGQQQTEVGETETTTKSDSGEGQTTGDESQTAEAGGGDFDLRLIVNHDFDRFDHNTGWMAPPASDLYENLITRDYEMSLQPGLAVDWTFENNNEDLVFDLREGVTFHDGSEFNAEYVKWFMEDYLLNGSGTAYMVDGVVSEVIVEDTHVARLKLERSAPNLLWNLSTEYAGVVSREAYEEYDDYGQSIAVGTGPYQWVSRDGNRNLELERYDDYDWAPEWVGLDGPGRASTVTYDVVAETASRTGALETGEADVILTGLPTNRVEPYEGRDDITVHRADGNQVRWLGFNLNPEQSGILGEDLALRKAISYSINRENILQGLFQGIGREGVNLLPPTVASHNIGEEYNHTYDADRATTLMEDAGWTVNPDGVSTKDGEEASFELLTTNSSIPRRLATVYQEQVTEIGVELQPEVVDQATVQSRVQNGDFEAIVEGYTWQNADILDWFFAFDQKPYPGWFGQQPGREADETANTLIEDAMTAGSWENRVEKFKEAHRFLMENLVPAAPVHYPASIAATHENVTNFDFFTLGTTVETINKE